MPPVFENFANLQVQRKGSESCSPSSCSEDQYSKVKVLATGIQGMGKLKNKSYAFFEFMKPGFALFRPYYSGRAKSGCGGVLAVDIDDFRCQRSA